MLQTPDPLTLMLVLLEDVYSLSLDAAITTPLPKNA